MLDESTSYLINAAVAAMAKFTMPTSRVFWGYILLMPVVALLPYLLYYKKKGTSFNPFGYLRFLFPKREYAGKSARLDYQLFLLNIVLDPVRIVSFVVTPIIGVMIYRGLNQIYTPHWEKLDVEASPLSALCFAGIFFLFNDFAYFLDHYTRHKIPALWQFHRVHHSAETLNPMTVYRSHPADLIFENAIYVFTISIVVGVLGYFTVENLSAFFIAKMKLVIYAFNLLGMFRHSHVWIPFGPFWSKIFMSPAQHMIHHSAALPHRDKNNGRMLSVWDWMFGTLYIPENEERHELVLGIDATELDCHPNLLAALIDPFKGIFRAT